MTARTSTLRGPGAGRYYVEHQLGYYLDRGEPPGRWLGRGAAHLGLGGVVDEDHFLALMGGNDPHTGRLLGTRHTERTVRGFDVTCSAPKSVSVLFAVGDEAARREVLASHDAAVGAVVDWIERHAHCRYRVNGNVCVFDADGITAAVFRQHTSRALDPQLHSHVVIVNRVLSPDGRWLALDARTIKRDQQTLSRLYHAGLRAEMTRRLGVRWRAPANGIAEIDGVPDDVLAEFSRRTQAVAERIDEKLDRFVDTSERAPTPRERWKLEREAVIDSRPPKADADPVTLDEEWRGRLAEIGFESERIVGDAVGVERGIGRLTKVGTGQLVERALGALAEKQSTWRIAELVRELAAAVPTTLAVPVARIGPWLDELANEVALTRMVDLAPPVPDGSELRKDGRPITEASVDRLLTLPDILGEEERLLALATSRVELGGVDHEVDASNGLTGAQRDLAVAVAGDHALVLAVGPAGTGKTTALLPAVEQLRREGRAAFGVAPSAAACEVLAADAGVDADTLDKLLVEHRLERPPDHRYGLPRGTTVILDEAAMVPTPRLAELFELAERRAWRLALIGDPLQFAAVGRSGMFGHLVDTLGAIELGRVHRFAHDWERDASLRLRRGDVSVVEVYEQHDRLHGGTARRMRRAVVDAWWESTARGETAAMMAPTRAAVVALNVAAQRRRLDAGHVGGQGRSIEVGPYRVHVGDVVATRQNCRDLVTDRHLMVKNRDHWTVEKVHATGALTVVGPTGSVRLPAAYVGAHVELAYAETSHANQGRTVDRSFLYLDGTTGSSGIYVPMTRGRESDEAFVVIQGEDTPADVISEALTRSWIDRPAVAVREEMRAGRAPSGDGPRSSPERPLDSIEVRRLLERSAELDRALTGARLEVDISRRRVESLARDRAGLAKSIADREVQLAAARATVAQLDRPLVRRRHRIELDAARRQVEWIPDAIEGDRAKLAALGGQERSATTQYRNAVAVDKRRPELLAERVVVHSQLDRDARARGLHAAVEPPPQLLDALGPRPTSESAARLWVDAVGHALQHRVAFEQRGGRVLGREPRSSGDDAYAASHRAAVEAIDRAARVVGRRPESEPAERSIELSL